MVVDDLEGLVEDEGLAGDAPVERLDRVLQVLDPELVLQGEVPLPRRLKAASRPAEVGFGATDMEVPVSGRLVPPFPVWVGPTAVDELSEEILSLFRLLWGAATGVHRG